MFDSAGKSLLLVAFVDIPSYEYGAIDHMIGGEINTY